MMEAQDQALAEGGIATKPAEPAAPAETAVSIIQVQSVMPDSMSDADISKRGSLADISKRSSLADISMRSTSLMDALEQVAEEPTEEEASESGRRRSSLVSQMFRRKRS